MLCFYGDTWDLGPDLTVSWDLEKERLKLGLFPSCIFSSHILNTYIIHGLAHNKHEWEILV